MISDWTSLKWQIWREKVLENGTKAVIGQTMERNVVRFIRLFFMLISHLFGAKTLKEAIISIPLVLK